MALRDECQAMLSQLVAKVKAATGDDTSRHDRLDSHAATLGMVVDEMTPEPSPVPAQMSVVSPPPIVPSA